MSTQTSEPPADFPTVFLSYSHQDEAWKNRLASQLRVLEMEGELDLWDDRRITAGADWLPEIEQAMDRASVALLLISADFLTSRFIRGTEVPRLLERRQEEGLRVIPVFVHPCPWKAVGWLASIQGRPRGEKALSECRRAQAEKILSDLAVEVRELLRDLTPCPPLPSPSPPPPGEGGRSWGGSARSGQGGSAGVPPLPAGGWPQAGGGRWERGTGGEVRLDLGRLRAPFSRA